ncbi:MAG: thiamine-phosphate kinase [Armatimonadetes bacterium]|nr:thiamine-phosphate kinase [Armatimonadota bacterium]
MGDDAALLDVADGTLAVTTDAVVEGVHFRREWFSWAEVGRRATYACLSDLAAVRARPLALFLTLGLPGDLSASALRSFTRAVSSAAEEFGCSLRGGDTTSSKVFFADLVAVGEVDKPWLRSGARPGDLVAVTGQLGAPAAAIALLQAGQSLKGRWASLRGRLLTPRPRVREALAVAPDDVHAAMDISDGLLLDASRLAEASGMRLVLEAETLPVAPGVTEAAGELGREPLEFVAGGGEEYELLVVLPPTRVSVVRRELARLDCPLTVVGRVEQGSGARLLDAGGKPVRLSSAGWEHRA